MMAPGVLLGKLRKPDDVADSAGAIDGDDRSVDRSLVALDEVPVH